mmetsp:Transcript_852/g.1361  ORF Transcript_852/g.1361 Transcript_852/m.1361 type:complete len:90 (+) Transcript_852:44-313(+)
MKVQTCEHQSLQSQPIPRQLLQLPQLQFPLQWFQKLLAHFIFHSNTLHQGRFQAAKVLLARHSFGSRHLGGKGFGIRRKNGSLQRSRRS